MEGEVFVFSWEDLFDKVGPLFFTAVFYVSVQNVVGGGE